MNQFLLKLISRKSLSLIAINKNQSEVKHCSKDNLFRCRHVTLDMISTFILCRLRWFANKLPTSLCGIPICCDLFRKRIDPKKFPFTATPNWNPLAGQWSVKYFFVPDSPIFRTPPNIRLDEDVLKTSWRSLSSFYSEDVFIKTNILALVVHLQKMFWRRLQDVLIKTNIFVLVICSKHLQNIFKTSCKDVFKTFLKRIIKLNCSC